MTGIDVQMTEIGVVKIEAAQEMTKQVQEKTGPEASVVLMTAISEVMQRAGPQKVRRADVMRRLLHARRKGRMTREKKSGKTRSERTSVIARGPGERGRQPSLLRRRQEEMIEGTGVIAVTGETEATGATEEIEETGAIVETVETDVMTGVDDCWKLSALAPAIP